MELSKWSGKIGGDGLINFSNELRRREIHRFALPSPSLVDSFDMGAPGNTNNLLDLSTVQGVVGIDGSSKNSGEAPPRLGADDTEV
jgi:hypothetical protein